MSIYIYLIIIFVLFSLYFFFTGNKPAVSKTKCPFHLPILGNTYLLGDSPHTLLTNLSKKYGDVYSFYFGSTKSIVLNRHEAVRSLLKHGSKLGGRPTGEFYGMDKVTNNGSGMIWCSNHSRQRETRKLAQKEIFSSSGLSIIDKFVVDEVNYLENQLLEDAVLTEEDFNPVHCIKRFTMSIITSVLFSKHFDKDDEVYKKLEHSIDVMFGEAGVKITDFVPYLNSLGIRPGAKRSTEACNFVINYTLEHEKLHSERIQKTEDATPLDYLDILLLAQKNSIGTDNESYFKKKNITQICVNLLAAGIDTTATTLLWTIFYMCKHPEWQDTVYDEIKEVCGENINYSMEYYDSFKYMHYVLYEVFRVRTIVPLSLFHKTTDDVELELSSGSYNIPKDTMIIPNLHSCHHDESKYEDPDTFNPNRFEGQNIKEIKKEIIPFSLGPRKCVGRPLAETELFYCYLMLFSKYRFAFAEQSKNVSNKPIYALTLQPKPYYVKITRRE